MVLYYQVRECHRIDQNLGIITMIGVIAIIITIVLVSEPLVSRLSY